MRSHIHLQWDPANTRSRFRTGVSLHSHTLYSKESLDFIYQAARRAPVLASVIRRGARRYREIHGRELDLSRGWWTPPLGPHDAWQLEKSQIEGLDLDALVSLTDHDEIEAGVSLQVLDECRGAPVSTEWTVPFRSTFFHLGVHNLPLARARELFSEMDEYRSHPREERLGVILAALAASPEVLIVFNHPLWDEKAIGQDAHRAAAQEFVRLFGGCVHALELNGLRPWRENRDVVAFAAGSKKPLISGGDRHALEPNALVSLTNAGTFPEFVEEIRTGWSDTLVLNHYREQYAMRIVHSMVDVLRTFDRHANGWKLWSDRVFYRCDDNHVRSLTELFGAKPPVAVAVFVGVMQFASAPHIRRFLRGGLFGLEQVTL
jgi:hypothetical protein